MVLQRPEAGNGRTGRPALRFPAATVQLALSSGLIERRENTLSAAPPLASYLKRAIARDRDEIFQEQHWDLQTVVLDVGKARLCRPASWHASATPITAAYALTATFTMRASPKRWPRRPVSCDTPMNDAAFAAKAMLYWRDVRP